MWFLPHRWLIGSVDGLGTEDGRVLIESNARDAGSIAASSQWFYIHNGQLIKATNVAVVIQQQSAGFVSSKGASSSPEMILQSVSIEQWLALIHPELAVFASDFEDWGYDSLESLLHTNDDDFDDNVFECSLMTEVQQVQIKQELHLLRRSKNSNTPGSSLTMSMNRSPGAAQPSDSANLAVEALVHDVCTVLNQSGGSSSSSKVCTKVYQMKAQNRAVMKAAGGAKQLCLQFPNQLLFNPAGAGLGHELIVLVHSGESIDTRGTARTVVRSCADKQMVMVAEASADIECILCFDEGLVLFRFEPCGHAQVCLECLSSWRRVSASKEAGYTSCPTCRKPIQNLPKEPVAWQMPAYVSNGAIVGVDTGGAETNTGSTGAGGGGTALNTWTCALCDVQDNRDWRCTGCNTTRSMSSETSANQAQALAYSYTNIKQMKPLRENKEDAGEGEEEEGDDEEDEHRPRYHVLCCRLGGQLCEQDVQQYFDEYYGAGAVKDIRFKTGSALVQFGFSVQRAAEIATECVRMWGGTMCVGTPLERKFRIEEYKQSYSRTRSAADGFIFHCSHETFSECVSKALFGAPQNHLRRMQEHIGADTVLFLYNAEDKKLHGVWKRSCEAKVHKQCLFVSGIPSCVHPLICNLLVHLYPRS
jgi:hypothetical protein